MIDAVRFFELAGHFEFDEGETRFRAETLAAERIGFKRHEVISAIRQRNLARRGDHRFPDGWKPEGDMPGVQPASEEEAGQVPFGDVHAGRGGLVLPPLPAQRGGVSR